MTNSENSECGKMFFNDYIKCESKIKEDIEKINNDKIQKNKIDDIDNDECNKFFEEFKNILQKDKVNANAKQELIENFFLFKHKNINDK